MLELKGKTAVVTGGSRGFGRGVVEALAGKGMRVLAVARDRRALENLREAVKGEVEPIVADVTDAARAVEVIQRERPEVLVLNAGARVPIQESRYLTWEAFAINWEVDVRGTYTWAREALLAPLEKGSAIVVVASAAVMVSRPSIAGYITAKTAQVALAKCLAVEAEPLGIRVHYLLPNLTPKTNLGRSSVRMFARRAGVEEQAIDEQLGLLPYLTPAMVGNGIVQILTDPQYWTIRGFHIREEGMQPLGETEAILNG